jgi:hypothetical protein
MYPHLVEYIHLLLQTVVMWNKQIHNTFTNTLNIRSIIYFLFTHTTLFTMTFTFKQLITFVISRRFDFHCPYAKRAIVEMCIGPITPKHIIDRNILRIETMSGQLYRALDITHMDTVSDIKQELGVLCNLFGMNSKVPLEDTYKLNDLKEKETTLIIVFDPTLLELHTKTHTLEYIIDTIEQSYHSQYDVHINNKDISEEQLETLGSVHTLTLYYCPDLVDVSALGGVHTLTLYGCHCVVDVSALGGVHTLSLNYCQGVVDVSALGSVHTLSLYDCYGVVDVSALGSVNTLSLYYCHGVVDVSALGGVHTLTLRACTKVVDVSALGGVHTLSLERCHNVVDVSALGSVNTLILEDCPNVE